MAVAWPDTATAPAVVAPPLTVTLPLPLQEGRGLSQPAYVFPERTNVPEPML